MRRLTQSEVLNRIKSIHGSKYDLSKVVYKNKRTKINVVCLVHGDFETRVEQLLRGQGCPTCGLDLQGLNSRLSQEEFILRSNEIHQNKYHYEKVKYLGMSIKVIITCPIHGDFTQLPTSHLHQKSGCPKCGFDQQLIKRKLSDSEFLSRSAIAHGDRYNYSKVNYKNSTTKVEIICSLHGSFLQEPQNHLNGSGCPSCSIIELHDKQRKSQDDFIRDCLLVHGDKFNYSRVKYTGGKNLIEVICHKHGVFLQSASNHLSGMGCPNCNSSKGEALISKVLKEKGVTFYSQYTFENLKLKRKLKFDFYIPSLNLVIEFNGKQHYVAVDRFDGEEGLRRVQKSDKMKEEYCLAMSIRFEVIRFDEDIHMRLQQLLISNGKLY